ncbi:hypothetical protein GIV52_26420, partial [Pseudomonas syringae]|uniref:hypothetical protein n=1 Tax=Pseudomonas syringae TaxID=317 RepID=UPI001F2F0513
MTVNHLATAPRSLSDASDLRVTTVDSHVRFSDQVGIDALLNATRMLMPGIIWAAYSAGDQKCLLGHGDEQADWPAHIPFG